MLNTFPISMVAGAVFGFLAGLGVGGGSILLLWLTLVLGVPHAEARSINLLFFIPTALISSFFRIKKGELSIKRLLPAIICGASAAATTTLLSQHLDVTMLKRLFGILLLVTGLRELFYRPRKDK